MVPWWGKDDQSGGLMVEQATHIADLARHVAAALTRSRTKGLLRQCAAVVRMRFDYADAYQTHWDTDAARTSARTGEPVSL